MTAEALSIRSVDSMATRSCGLYLHIPFCVRKCLYCSFFSIPGGDELHDRYVRAVTTQVRRFARSERSGRLRVKTVFFGGGTPTVLPVSSLVDLLDTCRRCLAWEDDRLEVSIEANPATVTQRDLSRLVQAGFNRLSIGMQSLSDSELKQLGRPHTAEDARSAVYAAKKAGLTNISIDLMYGLPGQTVADWRNTLLSALELEPDHLSIYELTIEKHTPFARQQKQGALILPDENSVLEMMRVTADAVSESGFQRYEISNYARPGKQCRHNINYWRNGSYIGVGAGAVSCIGGRRLSGIADVEEFCRRIEFGLEPWSDGERLDREARFRETVIMGLRMVAGVSIPALRDRFNIDVFACYGATLTGLMDQDLVTLERERLRLTPKGLLVADTVMAELV